MPRAAHPGISVIVHLTDLHLGPAGARPSGVDTAASFRRVAGAIAAMEVAPDAIVISGDVAEAGDAPSYRRIRALFEEVLGPLGAPVLPVLGNHDDRATFLAELLDVEGHDAAAPRWSSFDLPDVRILLCDSNVPGRTWGRLGAAQLAWIDAELSTAGRPGVVVLHHPSTPRGLMPVDDHLLRDAAAFAEVVAAHDVAAVLCGHSHVPTVSLVGGALQVAAPATAYLLDPAHGTVDRRYEGAGFSVCAIRDGRAVVHPHVLPQPRLAAAGRAGGRLLAG